MTGEGGAMAGANMAAQEEVVELWEEQTWQDAAIGGANMAGGMRQGQIYCSPMTGLLV